MPSPKTLYDSVVRALRAELSDPDPDTPQGPNGRLSSFAQINPDIHDSGGFNRDLPLPGVDVTLDRKSRLDDGGSQGEWTGEWARDADGNPTGRIFSKLWEVRLLFNVVMWTGDEVHDITGLDEDLSTVLDRFDPDARADFLHDEDGNAIQNIRDFSDEGGEMGRDRSNLREYEHEAIVEFEQRIDEAEEYGPTPTVNNVLVPEPGEHYGGDEFEDSIEGDVPLDRIETEFALTSVGAGDSVTVASTDTALVYGELDHNGRIEHDGTVSHEGE